MSDSINWKRVRHFEPWEFDDPLFPGSGEHIDPVLLFQLDKLRHEMGWPIITHWEVGGCIDMEGKHGHASNSYHLYKNGSKAVDFHFETDADPRTQYHQVELMGFTGIGIYFWWRWNGKLLPMGFHVDLRPVNRTQKWRSDKKGEYIYLLGR